MIHGTIAIALKQQLRPALQQIQMALLEPATSDRVFAMGMSDYVEFTLLLASHD
ncbi:MAG TPA: hypothetical protein V6D20_04695 [Candidatus Obscuribacterales bacterium]